MPARQPHHQQAAARVAILARWRDADDPELIAARRLLRIARAEARLIEAADTAAVAERELRDLALGVSS